MFCQSLIRPLRSLKLTSRLTALGALALGLIAGSAAAAPDLVAEKITLSPKTAYLGSTTFAVNLTIRNAGTTAAGAQITRIWASKTYEINGMGDDVQIFSLPVPALAAGKSVSYTTLTATKVIVDPNRVGPTGADYLPVGAYFIAAQVDAFNQVTNETNEANFFKSSDALTVKVLKPKGPVSYLPATGTDNVSVIRQLQWTTVTNANRYDVSLARLKDTEQRFFPHAMIDITTPAQRVVLTDMKGEYNPYGDPGLNIPFLGINYPPNNTPDMLMAQDNKAMLYNRIYDGLSGSPRYQKPFVLFEADKTTYTFGTSYYASRKFGPGIITSLLAANMNFEYTPDRGFGWWAFPGMDAVFATYIDNSILGRGSEGVVRIVMNRYDFRYFGGGRFTDTITNAADYMQIDLPNYRGRNIAGDNTHPRGIKSLCVADFDADSDLDIMIGSDRYPRTNVDKIVIQQSDYRNSPNGDNDPWPYSFPVFTPRNFTNMNSTLEDVQDMAPIDFDADGLPDVIVASYHSDRLWLLHNTTNAGGNDRTTRSLDFNILGPLPTDDTGTSAVFSGANTVCVRDLNNDYLPDFIAGAYFDGKIVVYENQSYGPGGITLSEIVPHVLDTNLPNLEKVTTEDMNGDGLFDILVSSATNDTIIWYENKGNFQFFPHLATQNANRVGSIVVNDMNNDQMPDIVSYSQYDNKLTWFASWPTLNSTHLVSSNQIQPAFRPRQPLDFNHTYVWKVAAKAANVYSTSSEMMTFRTQPTRINIEPKAHPVNPIEPGAGLSITLDTVVDGPQTVSDLGVNVYADPILDRGFLSANDPTSPLFDPLNPNPMYYVGFYFFGTTYQPGAKAFLTPKFDATSIPEGRYNLYAVVNVDNIGKIRTVSPSIHDGIRNGVLDGVIDGYDTCLPGRVWDVFTNPTYGDDAYLAAEKLGVIWKPGMPLKPSPIDNARNVPTGTRFDWSASTAATGYDVYLNKSASTQPQYTSMTITNALPAVQSIATGDLNGDGLPDVAASHIAGANDARIYWMDSRSAGRSFGRSWVASGLLGAPIVRIADLDLDGKQDILAASGADSQIWWYKNLGGNPLALSAPNVVARNLAAINNVQPTDLDGDRDIDVLVASSVGNRLFYYERYSNGTYWPRVIDAGHGQALYARAADIDRDGDTDVVATFWNPNSVAWYENTGGNPPVFVRHILASTINNPRWLTTGDPDNDNDLDIAVVSQVEGRIYLFANNGAAKPVFATSTVAQGLSQPHGLEFSDFNHDTRLDLITATVAGNQLLYLMNNGGTPLTFTQFPIQSYSTPIMDLATADMDGDNFSEVAAATSGGMANWFDYVVNYNFGDALTNPLIKQNGPLLTMNSFQGRPLNPAEGYRWQVLAKRIVPTYGGTLERVTSSSLWTFFTGQSDLVAKGVTFSPRTVDQGQTVHFSVTETNPGFSDSAGHYTDVWASPDSVITRSGNDIRLARAFVSMIPAKGSTIRVIDVNTAAVGLAGTQVLPEGNYYIGVFVDVTNLDNSESSKENNKLVLMSPRLQITRDNNVGEWLDYQ